MNRFFEPTVSAITYPGAGSPSIDFTAADPKIAPERLQFINVGAIGIYGSRDGVSDHLYIPAGEHRWQDVGMNALQKLWFRLESAGSIKLRVEDF